LNAIELKQYGIDWDGPVSYSGDSDAEESVMVEPPANPLTYTDWDVLTRQYQSQLYPDIENLENNLMSTDSNYGVNMYLEIREWIESRIATYDMDV